MSEVQNRFPFRVGHALSSCDVLAVFESAWVVIGHHAHRAGSNPVSIVFERAC